MTKQELLRRLPKIDEIMRQESLVVLANDAGELQVTDAVRDVVSGIRAEIVDMAEGEAELFDAGRLDMAEIAGEAKERIEEKSKKRLGHVVNATGTILHTNLGRAPLCTEAAVNAAEVSGRYSNLEYNIKQGKRGSRHDLTAELIKELTGAEDALVVNNNAAATMLVLAALGKGKEVIVSRGELVEIGDSFRMPDIMAQSGAHLHEVGTSNKTKPSDYENAIITKEMAEDADWDEEEGERFETAALMKVHKSNYNIVGFTQEASLEDLVKIGKEHNLPVIFDMGNGLMFDMSEYGVKDPNVRDSLATGIDVLLFSGDKLLGGPQAGIIAGKSEYIKRMKRHPLARAMRMDKLTYAALEVTLMKYRDKKAALRDIPVLSMISADKDYLKTRAEALAAKIREVNPDVQTEVVEVEDQIGGGTAPGTLLEGWAVSVRDGGKSADRTERKLRKADVPVVARIHDDKLLLSVRTIAEDELGLAAEAFK